MMAVMDNGENGVARTLDPGRIDALYSDMGNVLVKVRPERFFEALVRHVGPLDRRSFVERVLARRIYTDFARGVTTPESFARQLADVLGTRWTFEQFERIWVDMFDEIPGTREALGRALAAVPVFVLSNTDRLHWRYLRTRFRWLDEATATFLSCDVGLLKPEPDYYEGALARFGHRPERVLFVDDREENVRAAREAGLNTVRAESDGDFVRLVDDLWGRDASG
jgi:HAD superfamily hydrolase (TIGR01509 family)